MIAGNGICLTAWPAENVTRLNRLISPSVECRSASVWELAPKIFSSRSRWASSVEPLNRD